MKATFSRIKHFSLTIVITFANLYCFGQNRTSLQIDYQNCLDSLTVLAQKNDSLKKAVFLVENCFSGNELQYEHFNSHIQKLAQIVKLWEEVNPLLNYRFSDSVNFHCNFGIFKLLKDTIKFIGPDQKISRLLPYTYDFTDFFGRNDWRDMFVTKLLASHKGNCHSLPYLYKILADELGATCWLALAPNHSYISNRCQKIGWYNTELTSGTFPIDAWIMGSGYIPIEAIQNGIWMDTLSNQQSIALCILDLAKAYEHRTGVYFDGFILKCCDLSLKYFPKNVQAMLLKAETLKRNYEVQTTMKDTAVKQTFQDMESLYVRLFDLGYREMPEKMYIDWLQSVVKERNKYENKLVREVTQGDK